MKSLILSITLLFTSIVQAQDILFIGTKQLSASNVNTTALSIGGFKNIKGDHYLGGYLTLNGSSDWSQTIPYHDYEKLRLKMGGGISYGYKIKSIYFEPLFLLGASMTNYEYETYGHGLNHEGYPKTWHGFNTDTLITIEIGVLFTIFEGFIFGIDYGFGKNSYVVKGIHKEPSGDEIRRSYGNVNQNLGFRLGYLF